MRIQEFLQNISIFVVDMLNVILSEKALLCHINFDVRKNLSRIVRVEFFLTEFNWLIMFRMECLLGLFPH